MSKQRLRWWFLNFPQLRDISYSNIFNVHNPGKACTESFFNLKTAHLWPSIFCWKFVFICIVLSYLTVDTEHHTHLYTIVYGARNYRPCFRENQPKRSFSIKWKRAFWACFRENWVYKFGHGSLSGWSCWERSKLARDLGHKAFCLVWLVLNEESLKWFLILFFLFRNAHLLFTFNFCIPLYQRWA
jgi:hypothetical protein